MPPDPMTTALALLDPTEQQMAADSNHMPLFVALLLDAAMNRALNAGDLTTADQCEAAAAALDLTPTQGR